MHDNFFPKCNGKIIGWGLNFFSQYILTDCFQYVLLAIDLFIYFENYLIRACFNPCKLSIDFLLLVFRDG